MAVVPGRRRILQLVHHQSSGPSDRDLSPERGGSGRGQPVVVGEPISSLLTRVARLAHDAIPGADGAGLTVFDLGRADINAHSAPFVERIDDVQYDIGEGPCLTAATDGRTTRSGALGSEPRWPRFGPQAAALGVHSVLSLPLLSNERVLGTINVYAHRVGAFSDEAAEVGERFAVSAAAAVVNARVLSSAQRLAANLTLALRNQATIDQAIGVLIASQSLSVARAQARLRADSEAAGVPMAVLARRVIDDGTARAAQLGAS
jgi:GAF domain-containing protein